MAATIAKCQGVSGSKTTESARYGSIKAVGEAATRRTFAKCVVCADGSGLIEVVRDGVKLHSFAFDSEAPKS